MNEVMAIAEGTWRRILRMRVVYFLIACVVVLIGSAVNYDILSMGEHRMLMIDVSLVLNTVAAVLVAISLTFEIPKELREGVASTLLTKPLGRTQYLVGKMVGTAITGIVINFLIAFGFCIIFSMAFDERIAPSMIQGHLLIMASMIPMSAIAVLFSVIIPEMIAALVTAVVIWFSFSTPSISKMTLLYGGILPDLNLFNLKSLAVYGSTIYWGYIFLAILWGASYAVFVTALSSLIFRYKDLK